MITPDDLTDLIKPGDEDNTIIFGDYLSSTFTDFRLGVGHVLQTVGREAKAKRQAAPKRAKVGIHGRNAAMWESADFAVLTGMKAESVKMMSGTNIALYAEIKRQFPEMFIITRLYDDRVGVGHHPNPDEFAAKAIPTMQALKPYCTHFQVLNEPNHLARYEGWGQDEADARDFNDWFQATYTRLKNACPWAQIGFPGLAIPHNDLRWLDLCRPAIELADWLGVHCYWQTPPGQERNHLSDGWGLRFKLYHQKFPDKTIHILEAGNSNNQANPPIPFPDDQMAREYTAWLTEVFKCPYIGSTAFFIMSSPDRTWEPFAFRTSDGRLRSVVGAIGQMERS